jgi:hypothetical protein
MAEKMRRINVKSATGRTMMQKRTKLRGRPTAAEKSRKSLLGWKTAAELMAVMLGSI